MPRPGVVVCRGSRAAEERLLDWLDALAAEARRDPSRLALPVRVVVPSRSLRRHVAAALVRPRAIDLGRPGQPGRVGQARRASAGVVVQTLFGLASEICERAGAAVPRGALLFEMLVERAARGDAALRRGLGDLEDGYLAAAPAVADLLDAGLEPELAEALDEALATDGPRAAGRAAVERARALVRVAARTAVELRRLGRERRSGLLRQAAEALRGAAPETLLPARAVALHGFVTASGVAADLLAALLRQHGATLLLDRPPVPGLDGEQEQEIEAAATARLAERAAAAAALAPPAVPVATVSAPGGVAAPRLAAFTAAGSEAEAREVARRLRQLLAGGAGVAGADDPAGAPGAGAVRPEGLMVVARDLAPYRFALRRHLRRLGVPFSGVGERGGLLPAGRRAWAALDLLRWGADAPADRWLDACEWLSPGLRADLRLALRALGAARLREVAALREQGFPLGVALPVRQGIARAAPAFHPAAAPRPAGDDTAEAPPDDPGAAPPDDGGEAPPDFTAETPPVGTAEAAPGGTAETAPGSTAEAAPGGGGGALPDASGEASPGDCGGALSYGAAEAPPDDDGEGRAVARQRRISGQNLRQGVAAAARLHDRLAEWPAQAAAAVQMKWLRGLLRELGLDRDPAQPLAAAVGEVEREVPGALPLGREELRLMLSRALGEGGRCALGGEGGGVQVLSVSEARGRTCDHLFLMGLNRGVFPRPFREDPLLPDAIRQVLQRMLPDLPLAREAIDDERHAFAQLLSAAPAVTLSWLTADDDGKPLPGSPLIERLTQRDAGAGVAGWGDAAPPLYPSQPSPARVTGAEDVRPADEHAVLAGLQGSRLDLGRLLPLAVARVREELGRPLLDLDPAAVAMARLRVLEELDPDMRTAAGRVAAARLGPYFGYAGPAAARGGHLLYVTHLEAFAACPWQLFLGRLLRIESPTDPLGALPGADPLRLGNLVHRALDRIVKRALDTAGVGGGGAAGTTPRTPAGIDAPRTQGAALQATPVGWPAAAEIEPLLAAAAGELLAEEGLVLPGLARALARHAFPYVAAAGEVDWPHPGATVPVCDSEIDGELVLDLQADPAGARRRVRFRADRADLIDGQLRFTDYKTGRPLSEARDAGRRHRQLLAEIRAGTRLQAVAYGLAAGDPGGVGRYLFLRPDLPHEAREVAVEAGDPEAREAFATAIHTLLDAWDAGSFFPRLLDASGRGTPTRCDYCTVAEACLQGDPGARRRLRDWTTSAAAAPVAHPAEAAMLAAWRLGAAVAAPAGDGG